MNPETLEAKLRWLADSLERTALRADNFNPDAAEEIRVMAHYTEALAEEVETEFGLRGQARAIDKLSSRE